MDARLWYDWAMLHALLVLAQLVGADPNLLTNPGFESGIAGWGFWANAADTGSATVDTFYAHSGTHELGIVHKGTQDWAESRAKQATATGEVWSWSAWIRVGALSGSAMLSFVTRDSAGNVQDWSASEIPVPVSNSTWAKVETRIVVGHGTSSIQPRIIGYGPGQLGIDDADFHRESQGSGLTQPLRLRNDSLIVLFDPLDLSTTLVDSASRDTVRFGSLTDFLLDSARITGDTLHAFVRAVQRGWPARLDLVLRGGALQLSLAADSASQMDQSFVFPGIAETRPGQFLAMPRGTGLGIPVEATGLQNWELCHAYFWDWQVSLALAGATDGKTGFVISVDQPWDASLDLETGPSGILRPRVRQSPSKHVWGHTRSVVVAPIRSGGWREMALRHRLRLDELGRVRDWPTKMAANPLVDRLRGASDVWIEGSGWSNLHWTFFDSLRRCGADRGVVHWRAVGKEIDSLNAHGWLTSVYEDYADAFPPGTSGYQSLEYPDGAQVDEQGTPVKGWLSHLSDGTDLQALEVCASRHPSMAKTLVGADQATYRRNARFIDVELAMGLAECWSTVHPETRGEDAANRVRTLSTVKDSFRLVTGSEQTRDFAAGHVDWGEGPMTIVSVADAGYDWNTPEAPEAKMDSISMSARYRVPLLPLVLHDAMAPTWYTGDGQSKVLARWDAKDAWNALYATIPLIQPKGRAMWDSLATRYLRSMVLLGSLNDRTGFSPMTEFVNLSADRAVQRTTFQSGWTVTANLANQVGDAGGTTLPPYGFLATNGSESVSRTVIAGGVRSRVRLSDRWYLDPEGSRVRVDGVVTDGPVFLRRESDTTLLLALVGNQTSIELEPGILPWPSTSLRAATQTTGLAVALASNDSGSLVLTKLGNEKFYRLYGKFGALSSVSAKASFRPGLRISPRGQNLSCRWIQSRPGPAQLDLFSASGRHLAALSVGGASGANLANLPAPGSPSWLRVTTPDGQETVAIPPVR